MLALVFLATSFLVGLLLIQRTFPHLPPLVQLAGGFLVGLLLTTWVTFLAAFTFLGLQDALPIGIIFAFAIQIGILVRWHRHLDLSAFKLGWVEGILVVAALAFSLWLMDQRLSGDPLMVSLNTWGDFGLHIALARSFSEGHNLPPEYPFFALEPIRYHFGFDFLAGALERMGLPIAWAFNLPAALAMTSMILLVFELGRLMFNKVSVGLVAVALLITNSSLAFLRYFDEFGNDVPEAISNLWDHNRYLAIGPYESGEDIAIYWTLNVFLTQSHIIVAIALSLFVAYGLIQPLRQGEPLWTHRALALGAMAGLSFWMNGPVYVAAMVFFVALFLIFGRIRESISFLVPAGLIALPQVIWLSGGLAAEGSISLNIGYLVEPLTVDHFITYWWLNLGLALPLMVLAAVWGNKTDRKLMLAVMAIFLLGNFVQLGRDLGGHNHKVFNTWEILMNLFVAFAFVRLWSLKVRHISLRYLGAAVAPVVLFFLVLSGIIDFMVIKNDPRFIVFGPRESTIDWIKENTDTDAVFLTAPQLYVQPSMAGRRLFLGFTQFADGAGYEVGPRTETANAIYDASLKQEACELLLANEIDFIEIGPLELDGSMAVNESLFAREFEAAFAADTSEGPVALYDVGESCLP